MSTKTESCWSPCILYGRSQVSVQCSVPLAFAGSAGLGEARDEGLEAGVDADEQQEGKEHGCHGHGEAEPLEDQFRGKHLPHHQVAAVYSCSQHTHKHLQWNVIHINAYNILLTII